MGDKTKIEWTDATWSPIRARHFEIQSDGSGKERIGWHCEHVSEGCRNCYAESINRRLGTGLDFKPGHLFRQDRVGFNNGEAKLFLDEEMLTRPLRWKRPRMIFVCSMTDLFADFVPDEWIEKVFAVMALCPQHTFQVLTKRSARMRAFLANDYNTLPGRTFPSWIKIAVEHFGTGFKEPQPLNMPLPNVWLGVSAERQQEWDDRTVDLKATPAAIRFVSAEPLLGPILGDMRGLDWVIAGGESGPGSRPMHPDWARSLRDQCKSAGIAFHFKQWGEWLPFMANPDQGWWHNETKQSSRTGFLTGPFLGSYCFLDEDGKLIRHHGPLPCKTVDPGQLPTLKVGKKAAGRLLDGVEHNGFPQVPS